jgi:hypothetical protein
VARPDPDDAGPSLASVRGKHPHWQIALENSVFVAVNRPAQTSQNIVVEDTLEELDGRLDELDSR